MNRPVNIGFLTPKENECMELLLQAQDIFDEICGESPQSSTDSYNFGHYLDAARSSILVRGARRLDPENLLVKHRVGNTLLDQDKKTGVVQMGTNSAMPSTDPVKPSPKPNAFRSTAAVIPSKDVTVDPEVKQAICETIPDQLREILNAIERHCS